jgi:hypothetical protein
MPSAIIKIRRATSIQWASSTRPLALAELGLDTTLNKIKAGNGTSLWTALPFLSVIPSEITELAQDAIDSALIAGTGITKNYDDTANTITLAVDSTIANKTYVDTAISSLSNTIPTNYVPLTDVGNADGIATLDSNGKIPDSEIPSGITRDSELSAAINNLINSAPGTLDTLGEIATALTADISAVGALTTVVNSKAPLESPTFTGTVSGITKNMVGLGSVDNTLDVSKPISTAQQTALDLKAPIDSPTFTGTVVIPSNTIRSSDLTWEMYSVESQLPNAGVKHGMFSHVHGTGGAYFAHSGQWWRLALMNEPAVDYYITNSGTGTYLVNGVSNGGINFVKGKKYRIIVNAVGHPFRIQTVSGGYSLADSYTTGITNPGTDNGSIIVELPQNAPDNLYYACEFHATMNGTIAVQAEEDTITINSKSASYTIAPIDSGRLIEMSAGGTVTIADSTLFPVGYSVDILQTGTSQVTIAGNGFTPNSTPGLKLRAQWSSATLIKRALNSWVVLGDLSA